MAVAEALWKIILGERFSSMTCKCGKIELDTEHMATCQQQEMVKIRKEIGMRPHNGINNNDTPRRQAIAKAHIYLKMLSILGHRNGEKYKDYAKIEENKTEENETMYNLMGEENMINKAIDAYWEEVEDENEYEEEEKEKYKKPNPQKEDDYRYDWVD